MSPRQTATTAVLMGMTLEQAQDALASPVEGECFWLAAHCGKPTRPGEWLCDEHRAWKPNLGDARGVWLRGEQ